jgi:hypothetical protein
VTLLEAYLAGCYPVVADTGAQGEIVRLAGGHPVPVQSMEQLVDGLASAVLWCANNREALHQTSQVAIERLVIHFSSERYIATITDAYTIAMEPNSCEETSERNN